MIPNLLERSARPQSEIRSPKRSGFELFQLASKIFAGGRWSNSNALFLRSDHERSSAKIYPIPKKQYSENAAPFAEKNFNRSTLLIQSVPRTRRNRVRPRQKPYADGHEQPGTVLTSASHGILTGGFFALGDWLADSAPIHPKTVAQALHACHIQRATRSIGLLEGAKRDLIRSGRARRR